jgi:lipopolysaccharide assembly outer membrane protein LptD (OstA)
MRLAIGCLIFTCCLLEAFSVPQERARLESEYEGARISVEADRLSRESANRWVAEGDVILTFQDTVLRAPYVLYDPITGEAIADQGVEISQGLQWLKGSRAEMNLRTNTGTIYDAEGYTDEELYVKAKRLIKTGPGRYIAQDGFLTACQEAVPKWNFTIRQASIQVGETPNSPTPFSRSRTSRFFICRSCCFPPAGKNAPAAF